MAFDWNSFTTNFLNTVSTGINQRVQAAADEIAGKKTYLEVLDLDKDENEVTQSVKEAVHNVVNDEEQEYDMFDPDKQPEGIKGIDY